MKDGCAHAYFFGYGSLVNAATHVHAPLHHATAKGWRRAWVAVPERALCYLTAVIDPLSDLKGAIAPVPGDDWATLDLREAAYARHTQSHAVTHDSPATEIALYAVSPERHTAPGDHNPILLSYLDTVVTGYMTLYGPQGAAEFFSTTSGWQAPVLNDRAAPRYSRTTPLSDEVRDMVDDGLGRQNCRIIPG
ncbi:gamma-glutamylcyclotransferase family protein [Sagittula salina]|uniref:Gamma-glutamylcyclotransferase n=1 Tax=Sagittula salina TaxID=2820268 RepID=A0A940MSL7_9RHOB|nr:gamma-glutamylcyclotransferase family protein [Sagittula salina]MBP0483267.1 gamma-glutamylcyclotransferase [Sagittula salina]